MKLKCFIILEIFLTFVLVTKAKLPLLYPKSGSTFKLIIGFGTPWDGLVVETITSGMVWRIHFRFPATIQELKHRTVTKLGRNMNDISQAKQVLWQNDQEVFSNSTEGTKIGTDLHKYVFKSYRWGVYQSLEAIAKRMGLNGRDCVLKSICEAAEEPFHYKNGMWGEIMHVLLTPSASVDKISEHADNEYYHAEQLGRSGVSCDRMFETCPRSLLDHFSSIYELSHNLAKYF